MLQIDHLSYEELASMILVPLTNDQINFQVMTDQISLENAVVQPKVSSHR